MYEVVHERVLLALHVIVSLHVVAIVFRQSVTRTYPYISLLILYQTLHLLIRQSIRGVKMLELKVGTFTHQARQEPHQDHSQVSHI